MENETNKNEAKIDRHAFDLIINRYMRGPAFLDPAPRPAESFKRDLIENVPEEARNVAEEGSIPVYMQSKDEFGEDGFVHSNVYWASDALAPKLPDACSDLMQDCHFLTDISGFQDLDSSDVRGMGSFFERTNINSLQPLCNWDVTNVLHMNNMFAGCQNLRSLEGLEQQRTANVQNFKEFISESAVESLKPLSDWNVGDGIDFSCFAKGCYNLKTLEGVEDWNLSSAYSIGAFAADCSSLQNIDAVKKQDVSKVFDASDFARGDSSLNSIEGIADQDLENANTTQTSWYLGTDGMFSECPSLTDVTPFINLNLSDVNYMKVFEGSDNIQNHVDYDAHGNLTLLPFVPESHDQDIGQHSYDDFGER